MGEGEREGEREGGREGGMEGGREGGWEQSLYALGASLRRNLINFEITTSAAFGRAYFAVCTEACFSECSVLICHYGSPCQLSMLWTVLTCNCYECHCIII